MLLLATIGDGHGYGYGLIRDLKERSAGTIDLAEGTVYSALHRMWRDGYLSRGQEWVDGRERLTYRLTGAGRELLAARIDVWGQVQTAVAAVLAGTSSSVR